jgi:membrane-bound serine protease (ClpP class)
MARVTWRVLFTVSIALGLLGQPALSGAQTPPEQPGPVYLVDISGEIDLGLAPYLDRVLDDAAADNASAVVVRINTPGGRLDAALQMRDSLLASAVPTVAFIDSTAFSAGALLALACEQIFMTPAAVMGAATPVLGGTGEVADGKTISAVRSAFEATAEARGRNPSVAGAMVDPDVEIEGVIEAGRLLTLTVSQAVEVGYTDGVVPTQAALLEELGLADAEQVETSPGLAERLVRLLTNPVLASLLLTVGILALIADLASGGIGIGVVVGASLLGVFFWGHMLAGLAGWEDIALVVLGLVLIAVEILVVPGFGVPGILGLASLLGGAFLAMLYRDFDFVSNADLVRAALSVSITLLVVVVGSAIVLTALTRGASRSGLVLQARVGVGEPVTERARGGWMRWFDGGAQLSRGGVPGDVAGATPTAADLPPHPAADAGSQRSLLGATGTALSDLRPSGVAEIDGERVDVVTSGEYVPKGAAIEVVRDDGYRHVVRRAIPVP